MIVPSSRLIGLAVLASAALVAGAAIPAIWVVAIGLIVTFVLAATVDGLLRKLALSDIHVELPPLLRLVLGREGAISVSFKNNGVHSRSVRVGFAMPDKLGALPEEQTMIVPAASSQLQWNCRPGARGTFRIERCYLEAGSPFGLWMVREAREVSMEIRVYPNLRTPDSLQALRAREDRHVTRQIGRGREFEKLREYAPGDSSDEIHWKASARRARPVTKVFQLERTQEIYVVLDCSRLSAREIEGEPALERAIRAALTVGMITESRNDLFGVAAFSGGMETFVRARSGKLHFAYCRDALNGLKPRRTSPDFEAIATFLRLQLRRRSLIIFLTSLDDPIIAEKFERAARLLSGRHLVAAATIRPPSAAPLFSGDAVESSEDVYRALAGHLGWVKLHELQQRLARGGVRLAMVEAGSLSTGVVSLYDDVRQRQAL